MNSTDLIDPVRFEVLERLGRGAQGTVYRVLDRRRGMEVALKVIPAPGSRAVLELKHEFRMASALWHPHLVRLFELFASGDGCYFTMEHVPGVSFDVFASSAGAGEVAAIGGQLAEAIHALHQAHLLHRDIKPANLLVSPGRGLVLLDFGFATYRGERGDGLGAPAYLAPELLAGATPSAASDWFSVGAVLWEALVGQPIERGRDGGPPEPRPAPRQVGPAVWDLVLALLSSDPDERPTGARVLEALGYPARRAQLVAPVEELASAFDLVGRGPEVARLRELHAASGDRSRVARLVGPSGIGKTATVLGFLDTLPSLVPVFRGRCGPREDVPFNALDEVMDSAARGLVAEGEDLPRRLGATLSAALARVFPVFRDLAGPMAGAPLPADGVSVLRLAIRAFLRLVESGGASVPVVWIDDLQWADRDSLRLLRLLLEESRTARSFIVFGSRSDLSELDGVTPIASLRLGPLSEADSLRLAASWIGRSGPEADLAARECGGSPLFLRQIVDHLAAGTTPGSLATVEDAIRSSLDALPPAARELAEFLAVVGRPVRMGASGAFEPDGLDPCDLFLLHDQRLLRGSADDGLGVEIYHDRAREVLLRGLPDARRRELHLAAARFLMRDEARPEEIVRHLVDGGRPQAGTRLARQAAEEAAAAFAFSRAADLYGLVLAIPDRERADEELLERRGEALSRCGRGEEAAAAYLEAAALQTGHNALDLRRRASEQLLRVGNVKAGLDVLAGVLRDLRLPNPSSWLGTIAWLGWTQLVARRSPASAEAVAPHRDALQRIDACFSAGLGLNMIDVRRSMLFQALQLALARRSGDPLRLSRSLAVESTYLSTRGARGCDQRATELIERSRQLAEQVADPDAIAFSELCAGVGLTVSGAFREAIPMLDAASERYRAHRDGVTWEVANCDLYKCWSAVYLGELGRLSRLVPRLQHEAEQRSDALAQIGVSSGIAVVAGLVRDEPEQTRARARTARNRLPRGGFQSLDYFDLIAETTVLLYEGRGREAYERVRREWPRLRRGLFLNLRFFRVELRFLRARAAVAFALELPSATRRPLLADARSQAHRLQREDLPLSRALARVLSAELEAIDGSSGFRASLGAALTELAACCPLLLETSSELLASGGTTGLDVRNPDAFLRIWQPAVAASVGRHDLR